MEFTIGTAEKINQQILNRKQAKKRSRPKVATPCIQAAERILAQVSMDTAISVQYFRETWRSNYEARNTAIVLLQQVSLQRKPNKVFDEQEYTRWHWTKRATVYISRKKPLRTPPKTVSMCIDMAGTASDQGSMAMRSEVMGSSVATTVALYL